MSNEIINIYICEAGVFGFGIERPYGCDARYSVEGFEYSIPLEPDEYEIIEDSYIESLFNN